MGENSRKSLTPYSTVRVIGVARDVACESFYAPKSSPCVYLPASPTLAGASVFVKVNQDTERARHDLDVLLSARVPGAVQQNIKLSSFLAGSVYPFRAASWICTGVGTLALLLTLSGVYGVLSYLVTQRTREIGIRVALGATRASVIGMVLRQSLRYSFRGAALGAVIALGIAHLLSSHVRAIHPFDSAAYVGAILTVIAAAMAAAYFPSRRAASVDPASTLRCD
jgi:hypothetical protein